MQEQDAPPEVASPATRNRAIDAVAAITWLVSALAAGAALAATLVDYFQRGAIPARSAAGIGVMLAGGVMVVAALALLLNARRFSQLGARSKWVAGIVAPLAGLLLIALFMRLGLRSPSPVLPLPFTPTVSVRFSAGSTPAIVTLPAVATSGGVRWRGDRRAFEYECLLAPDPPSNWPFRGPATEEPPPSQSIARLSATASPAEGREDCRMTVVTTEAITLYLGGIPDPDITVDGTPMPSPLSLQPGTFEVSIRGSYE